ncbi:nucleotidyltransferase domain-containing protein [Halanaerobium hydrogeniformans]|uniref:nucleotidyltransferase domain-containing protein n=1 Tax=Halanaerobium hydrogeniformans TaxID=656519 RepID=UPI00030931EC|nr:nucleotidyltransferase domain-containing protein [Halanaerobium hydrogeniformans]
MNIEKLKEILLKRKEIIFAYLFGSFAENKENSLSDIDLAVYIDQSEPLHLNQNQDLHQKRY